jgi:AAHS family 4-hydroxybenzoate transporter-like MFS transporter
MVGVAIGSILLAWLGDRLGRKPVLVISTFGVGLFSLATTAASDMTLLTMFRFLLGVSFGAGMPNMYSLTADIVPSRNRIFCMTLLTAAASIGGIVGGFVAPVLSERLGWEGIFLPGGFIPLAIGVAMIFLLLESPRILAARGRLQELASVLTAFGLDGANLPEARAKTTSAGSRPTALLRDGLLPITVFYLIGWIGSGLAYSLLVHWLPTLMVNVGWASDAAQRSVTSIYGGSLVGGLALSWIMDRWQRGGVFVPALAYAFGATLFIGIAVWLASPLVYMFLLGVGLAVGGAQYVLPALVARVFPLDLLTTAFSWIGALARIGPIIGPILVGWMMLAGWSGPRIVLIYTLVPLCSAIAFAIMALVATRRTQALQTQ